MIWVWIAGLLSVLAVARWSDGVFRRAAFKQRLRETLKFAARRSHNLIVNPATFRRVSIELRPGAMMPMLDGSGWAITVYGSRITTSHAVPDGYAMLWPAYPKRMDPWLGGRVHTRYVEIAPA